MPRHSPPDHRGPQAVAGLRQRLLERTVTPVEIERLRRLSWAALQREALEADVPLRRMREAATRDELRLLILEARARG